MARKKTYLEIDVMTSTERFYKTLKFEYCPIFMIDLNEVEKFIRQHAPIAKGWKAIICGQWTNNTIYGREEFTFRF